MDKCSACNTPAPWCWLRSIGRCDRLAEPDQARHNEARSPIGPTTPPPADLPPIDPAEAARIRRAGKPHVPLGCGPCHGKPADPPPDSPGN